MPSRCRRGSHRPARLSERSYGRCGVSYGQSPRPRNRRMLRCFETAGSVEDDEAETFVVSFLCRPKVCDSWFFVLDEKRELDMDANLSRLLLALLLLVMGLASCASSSSSSSSSSTSSSYSSFSFPSSLSISVLSSA